MIAFILSIVVLIVGTYLAARSVQRHFLREEGRIVTMRELFDTSNYI